MSVSVDALIATPAPISTATVSDDHGVGERHLALQGNELTFRIRCRGHMLPHDAGETLQQQKMALVDGGRVWTYAALEQAADAQLPLWIAEVC